MTSDIADSVTAALARAVIYRTLTAAFQPPTDPILDAIGARDGFPIVVAAVRFLNCPAVSIESVTIGSAVLAADYWRLFGHTTRGLVCTCETEYGPDNGFHQPQQLADIAGYYLAFGLHPARDGEVRPDHIACECEFLDFLSRKQAYLLGCGDSGEQLATTAAAERSFVRDHLGRFGRAFGARVASEDRNGFYGAVGRLLLAFVALECARLGIDAGPLDLIVRPEDVDDAPMACASADAGEPAPLPFYRQNASAGGRVL
jgi:TorA maturation chaperone TorD